MLQAHHIIPMGVCLPLKYDLENGILLCFPSHFFWAHSKDPLVQKEVLAFYESLPQWKYLKDTSRMNRKNDLSLIEVHLTQELKKHA